MLLSAKEVSRVVEIAWNDRTPFKAIEFQFGLNQNSVIKLMRAHLKKGSCLVWRTRTHGQVTKDLKLRSTAINQLQSYN